MYVNNNSNIICGVVCDNQKQTKEEIKQKKQLDKEEKIKLKYDLIKSGKYDIYTGYLYAQYSKCCAQLYGTEMNKNYEQFLGVDLDEYFNSIELKLCEQIYNSRRQKIRRLKKKLEYNINNYDCLWLTLTFRDEVLNSTSEKTRRTYIQRFCKSLNVPFYVSNIDFGDKEKNSESNEREHYHAIIRKDWLDMNKYDYGFVYVEKIRNDANSITKISKYINKLTYHAYKDSTQNNRLIYSRNTI